MTTADILAELPRLTAAELARVQAAIADLTAGVPLPPIAGHPALGIWRDRADLPVDPNAASALLGRRMMNRDDTEASSPAATGGSDG